METEQRDDQRQLVCGEANRWGAPRPTQLVQVTLDCVHHRRFDVVKIMTTAMKVDAVRPACSVSDPGHDCAGVEDSITAVVNEQDGTDLSLHGVAK